MPLLASLEPPCIYPPVIVKNMDHPLVVQASALIRAGDIVGAESALVALVDTEGDHALVAILEELPPKDLLAVIREYDSSKESLVNLLVTPEQFARALVLERQYADRTHAHLRGMINSVIFREGVDPAEFLEVIGETDGGCEALTDYLSDRDEEIAHFAEHGSFNVHESGEVPKAQVMDHDWMELTWLLHHDHAAMFSQILPELKKRIKARHRQEALEEMAALALQEPDDEGDMPVAKPAAPAAPLRIVNPTGEESAL
jgi:hypothetical protein